MKQQMKTMMKLPKTKGSILQIVLIIFVVLILNISLFYNNIIENSKSINQIKELNEQRLIELSVLRYYKEMIATSILLSDYISFNDYIIEYTVDDYGNYYYIKTTITKDKQSYVFDLEIELDTLVILRFEYQ